MTIPVATKNYLHHKIAATAIGAVDAEYFYDPAGNRMTSVWDNAASVYTANGLNQYGMVTAGGLSRYGAISRRAAKGAEPQRRGKRRRFFNTKITENTKNTKC